MNHKKVKIDVFALDIDFKLGLWVHITPLTDFAPKKIQTQTGSAARNSKKHRFLFKKPNSGRHDAVIASWLRLDR